MARCNRIPVQMQLAVYLDEGHRPAVASEDRERGRAQVLPAQGLGIGCDRRDGRRTAPMRHAEPVHDVLWVDAGPHDDAQLGQLRAHVRELQGEGLLRLVELGGASEQGRALAVELRELARSVRDAAVAGGIADCGQTNPRANVRSAGGSADAIERADRTASLRHLHRHFPANLC
jgi:hypothetical protein